MNQEEKSLIDRYLADSLTGSELNSFMNQMNSNPEFRRRVDLHKLLINGIRHAEDTRLTGMLQKQINYEKPLIPYALKLIVTFLVVTIGGIALWNYLGPEENKRPAIFSLDFLRTKHDTIYVVAESEQPKVVKPIAKTRTPQNDTVVAEKKGTVDTASTTDASADIVVKKDQMLISFVLRPIDVQEMSKSKELQSENSTDAGKAEPQEAEGKVVDYNVEFWVSPVNYKGYKLQQDKLILFGIEEPDAVQLFSNDNNLWMKYGKEYYALHPSEEFESLIQSSEIPQAIK